MLPFHSAWRWKTNAGGLCLAPEVPCSYGFHIINRTRNVQVSVWVSTNVQVPIWISTNVRVLISVRYCSGAKTCDLV